MVRLEILSSALRKCAIISMQCIVEKWMLWYVYAKWLPHMLILFQNFTSISCCLLMWFYDRSFLNNGALTKMQSIQGLLLTSEYNSASVWPIYKSPNWSNDFLIIESSTIKQQFIWYHFKQNSLYWCTLHVDTHHILEIWESIIWMFWLSVSIFKVTSEMLPHYPTQNFYM